MCEYMILIVKKKNCVVITFTNTPTNDFLKNFILAQAENEHI